MQGRYLTLSPTLNSIMQMTHLKRMFTTSSECLTDSLSVLLTAVEGACWEVLDQADPLCDLDLLLLSQLAGLAGHVGGRIEYLGHRVGLLQGDGQYTVTTSTSHLDIWRRLLQLLHTVAGGAVSQQGDVICCRRLQTVPHPPNPSKHGRTATR